MHRKQWEEPPLRENKMKLSLTLGVDFSHTTTACCRIPGNASEESGVEEKCDDTEWTEEILLPVTGPEQVGFSINQKESKGCKDSSIISKKKVREPFLKSPLTDWGWERVDCGRT